MTSGGSSDPFGDADRVWPSDVLHRGELYGEEAELARVIRRSRQVAGTAIPEPRVIDDDARWAYWFAPDGALKQNVAEDRDNVLLLKGPPGVGKSTLELRIMRSMYPDIDAPDLKKHLAFSVSQLLELLLSSRETFVGLDEAAVGGGAANWHSPEAQQLIENSNTMRWRHNTVAFLIPNPEDFLKALRIRRAEFHVGCQHRPKGKAVIRTKNWDLERPLKSGDLGLRTDWRFNPIVWEPFPPDDPLWVEYTRLKMEADDRRARRGLAILRAQETFTTGRAAKQLKIPARTLRRWVERGLVEATAGPAGVHRLTEAEVHRIGTQLLGQEGHSGHGGRRTADKGGGKV